MMIDVTNGIPTRAQLRRQGLDERAIETVLAQFAEESEPEVEEEELAPAILEKETPKKRTHSKIVASTDPDDIDDFTLSMAAEILTDLERTRIDNENRLRQLTRDEPDADGYIRGFGLAEDDESVEWLVRMVEKLQAMEESAIKHLERQVRKNPLGPWISRQKGVGYKQAARLLAAIGDPYWHAAENRPRLVSELWSYCGHGGESRRKRGEKVTWNPGAKMRTWNIANSCIKTKGHYREVYDARREETFEKDHSKECVRCGPSGKPAQPGTPWSKGHQHADALRIVGKEILKDLWIESKRIHDGLA